jgi:glycosyltransferase involved in cell wall biosynthesis
VTVGLVHDHLLEMRGAERTFAAIADLWPEAPIYTLVYDEETTDGRFAGRDVHSSMVQGSNVRQRGFRRMQRLFAWAIRRLPVHDHDVVLSSSTAFALGVRPRRDAVHVCYCHSLFREAWSEDGRAPLAGLGYAMLRRADRSAAAHVNDFIANSAYTQARLEEAFGREATVIHPPVEVERFSPREPEDYYLVVGDLVPHKRTDIALEAARLAGIKLKVVGSGPEYRRLLAKYGEVAEFMRRLADEELAQVMSGAQALIVPNIEEFGIAAVEIQAAGRPVVGVDAGGLRETVLQDVTGVLVEEPSAKALAEALTSVDPASFDSSVLREHAQQFATERFQREMRRHVDRLVALHVSQT